MTACWCQARYVSQIHVNTCQWLELIEHCSHIFATRSRDTQQRTVLTSVPMATKLHRSIAVWKLMVILQLCEGSKGKSAWLLSVICVQCWDLIDSNWPVRVGESDLIWQFREYVRMEQCQGQCTSMGRRWWRGQKIPTTFKEYTAQWCKDISGIMNSNELRKSVKVECKMMWGAHSNGARLSVWPD